VSALGAMDIIVRQFAIRRPGPEAGRAERNGRVEAGHIQVNLFAVSYLRDKDAGKLARGPAAASKAHPGSRRPI